MPARWPLARQKRARLAELGEYSFIDFLDSSTTSLRAVLDRICREAGFARKVTQWAAQPSTMLTLVANGLGIAIVSEAVKGALPEGVALVPLVELTPQYDLETAMAWVPSNVTPALKHFIAFVEQAAARAKP